MLELIHASPFLELAALLTLAAGVGFICLLLRQPLIIAFIAVGMLAGPSALGLVRSRESIDLLAELGIAVLLFLVGLKLDLKLIRTLGVVAVATGLGQVAFTSIIGFGICLALGFDVVTSVYVAVALTFSSTIIIVKLLGDKREIDSLHGRIALGFLIVQDLVVVLAMLVLAAFGVSAGQEAEAGSALTGTENAAPAAAQTAVLSRVLLTLAYAAAAVLFVGLFIRFVADPLVRRVARSPELLLTFAIAWAALLAAAGYKLGFSMELGGLLAGVSLASTPFREAIVSRLAPLRDFLLLFFFIALGSELEPSQFGDQALAAAVLSLFVLIGNPLIVIAIMSAMGYRKRTGFFAGLTVAQISEFSLIFVAMGVSLGHITDSALALVTVVGLATIALSVYMITYSHPLYRALEPALAAFERPFGRLHARLAARRRAGPPDPDRVGTDEDEAAAPAAPGAYDVVLFGLGRYGSRLAEQLREAGWRVLGVDFNPDELRTWRAAGLHAVYGDATDHEFLESLPLAGVKWVIAALPQVHEALRPEDPRATLIAGLRRRGFTGRIAAPAHNTRDADDLKSRGADLVLMPFTDAAQSAAKRILESPVESSAAEPRPTPPEV